MPKQVLFDTGPIKSGTAFVNPLRLIDATQPEDVPTALAAMEEAIARGYWLAGFTSYELGYVFESKLHDLMPAERSTPLMHFGVFKLPVAAKPNGSLGPAAITNPEPDWELPRYDTAFQKVMAHLAAGDIYQANITFRLSANYVGTPRALYEALRGRQPVPFGAFVDLGGPTLLSRSPELFFAVDEAGRMETKPMKGTAARGRTSSEDAAQLSWLSSSEKNRAENAMIVDLMRNDMSRLCEAGSVKVPDLFTIETYATVHQMTSRIVAQLRPRITLRDIFAAMFPSGSITGAPKIRAMQIVSTLEETARDAYCGAIGWISPTGAMQFNVAIRTILCFDDGAARLNVGSGVVFDSVAEQEYAEALAKSQFAVLDRV